MRGARVFCHHKVNTLLKQPRYFHSGLWTIYAGSYRSPSSPQGMRPFVLQKGMAGQIKPEQKAAYLLYRWETPAGRVKTPEQRRTIRHIQYKERKK